ncbi:ABC transporter substrate-binding protein [Stappia sp.]|uniref:ABC transporter substrate-binding protein n=1 Tax=Stappia sp. TaxID=1870903 RepID=UPI0025DA72B6|nr:ABC transporter substrate-binding protein [Stappia sp.]
MTRRLALLATVLAAGVSLPGFPGLPISSPALAATLTISCGAVAMEYRVCREGVQAWERETGHNVTVIPAPNSSTERLALYQQILSGGTSDIDVFQIDVYWPGLLAGGLMDLSPYAQDAVAEHFPASIANNTVEGRLVAMPWFGDAGLLYYRKDLLEKYGKSVPTTWQELTSTAEAVQRSERLDGQPHLWGFVFQARAYEGLTCVALEWVASFGGGMFIASDGEISIDNPAAEQALALAASWIGHIAPVGVLNYTEEESRRVFQSGNAVFMRNWPYAWALVNGEDSTVRDKVGVAHLPRGADGAPAGGTLGGWQLAVARNTIYPREAADLVLYLTGRAEQKRRAIRASFNPTIPALYRDPDVLAAVPFLEKLRDTFDMTFARPSGVTGTRYPQVSQAIFTRIHAALSGHSTSRETIATLARDLKALRRDGW